jgi:hypothetical protein
MITRTHSKFVVFSHPFEPRGDGRAADVAVKGPQLLVQVGERPGDEDVHPSQQMVLRNHIVQVELIKQPQAAFSGLARLYSLTWTV